jgi:CII-binding regulator of phage lambda lysogenization HflD
MIAYNYDSAWSTTYEHGSIEEASAKLRWSRNFAEVYVNILSNISDKLQISGSGSI